MATPVIAKVTPVLVVSDVEACARFWEKLGLTRGAEVPHEGALGFVIMQGGDLELMYQSVGSVKADDPTMGERVTVGGASLFVETPNLDDCARAIAGATIIVKERTTFYGMREIGVLDPGGNLILFAEKSSTDAK